MSWTDERIDELRRLWAEGLSASQIANSLGGVTRNAVIGKIHRLGLSGRVKTRAPARRTAPAAATVRPQPQPAVRAMAAGALAVKVVEREAPAVVMQAEVVPLHGGVDLMELSAATCRWPVGDPAQDGFRFCGARVGAAETYCKAHAEVAYPARAKARSRHN